MYLGWDIDMLNPEQLATTLWAEPFCNYTSECSVSHINMILQISRDAIQWLAAVDKTVELKTISPLGLQQNFFNTEAVLQSTDLRMSLVVMPAFAAAVTESLCFEGVYVDICH